MARPARPRPRTERLASARLHDRERQADVRDAARQRSLDHIKGAWAGEVGLRPATPQCIAGKRIEPATSLPWPMAQIPDATAAAAPPDDPRTRCARPTD